MKNIKTDYLSIFEHICSIPHGSGDTAKIAAFCRDFAMFYGCDAFIDDAGNVIIKCAASEGFEDRPTVILQGHTDMVCEKTLDSTHDFTTDPLKLIYEDGYLHADGTTLGGDDGIAVAFALSIIADKSIKHPPLEILLTTDEETGMNGAEGLDGTVLSGRRMINIDSEEEGVLLAGCAGGITAVYKEHFSQYTTVSRSVKITLSGLAGGHSGAEIHKKRLNGIKALANIAGELVDIGCCISEFKCGSKMNAIPFGGFVTLTVPAEKSVEVQGKFDEFSNTVEQMCVCADDKPELNIVVNEKSEILSLSNADSIRLCGFLCALPDGIIGYTDSTEKLVQTSLNIGVAEYKDGEFLGLSLIRSSKNDDIDVLVSEVSEIAKSHGINAGFSDRYPAWEYRESSELRDKMCDIYKEMFGTDLKVDVIHAGLECGILSGKLPGLDCVSIGPNILDIHTSSEKLDLASAERCYKFILKVLEEL